MSKSTPDPARTRYHHGDLRAALVEATRQLIEEKGSDHFSVSDACRRAGVSTAAPYKHFKNKDEMVLAVMLESMDRHYREMQADIAPHPEGSLARIKALGQNYISFALREPGVFRLRFGDFHNIPHPQLETLGHNTYGVVLDEVAKCLGEPGITDKVRERGFMLWSFVHGLSFLTMNPELADLGGNLDVDALLTDVGLRILTD